jgi:hypothetical protein
MQDHGKCSGLIDFELPFLRFKQPEQPCILSPTGKSSDFLFFFFGFFSSFKNIFILSNLLKQPCLELKTLFLNHSEIKATQT